MTFNLGHLFRRVLANAMRVRGKEGYVLTNYSPQANVASRELSPRAFLDSPENCSIRSFYAEGIHGYRNSCLAMSRY